LFNLLFQAGLACSLLFLATSPNYRFSVDPLLALAPLVFLIGAQAGGALAYPFQARLVYSFGRVAAFAVYSPLFYKVFLVERNGTDWVLERPWFSIRRLWDDQTLFAAAKQWDLTHSYLTPPPLQETANVIATSDHSLSKFLLDYSSLVARFQPPPVQVQAVVQPVPSGGLFSSLGSWILSHPTEVTAYAVFAVTTAGLFGFVAFLKWGWVPFSRASVDNSTAVQVVLDKTVLTDASQNKALEGVGKLVRDLWDASSTTFKSHSELAQATQSAIRLTATGFDTTRFVLFQMMASQSLLFSLLGENYPPSSSSTFTNLSAPPRLPEVPSESLRQQVNDANHILALYRSHIIFLYRKLGLPTPSDLLD